MGKDNKKITCRVCLRYDSKVSKKCLSIFESLNGSSISERVNSIANVNIKKGDGLPDKICPECLLQLENAVLFKVKCEASNQILLCNLLKSKKPVEKSIKEEFLDENYLEAGIDSDDHYIELSEEKSEPCQDNKDITIKEETLLPDKDPNWPKLSIPLPDLELVLPEPAPEPLRTSRAIDLKLICDDCGGIFKSKCKLRVHWKQVHLPERLLCKQCKRQFKSYPAYNLHLKKRNKNCQVASKALIEGMGKSRVFHCKECNYRSKRIKDMKAHLAVHSGDKPYECKDCLKRFSQHSSLQAHRESEHKDFRIDTFCHLCGQHLQGRSKFYKHMRLHKEESVQCKVCNKTLKSKRYLPAHMLRHTGIKSYHCEVCGASFFTMCELCNHKTKVHKKSKRFKCSQCDYKMASKFALNKHLQKHNGTNVVCMVCGQFMANEEALAKHQRSHFERNMLCPQCDKTFYHKRSLSKHMCKDHQCSMLVERNEEVQTTNPIIKEETTAKKEEYVILLSPPAIIIK